jgi:hypothetical protein
MQCKTNKNISKTVSNEYAAFVNGVMSQNLASLVTTGLLQKNGVYDGSPIVENITGKVLLNTGDPISGGIVVINASVASLTLNEIQQGVMPIFYVIALTQSGAIRYNVNVTVY